jgi:hypothetical protein
MALVVALGFWVWSCGYRRITLGIVFCGYDLSGSEPGSAVGGLVGS